MLTGGGDPTQIQVLTTWHLSVLWLRLCKGRVVREFYPLSTISALVPRILTTTLTTRIPMHDGKSRSEDFQDLQWDRESRHWREPWEKERNGNEKTLLRMGISIHYLDHPILTTVWATIGRRLMQDHCTWDRILTIGSPLVLSRALDQWTRGFLVDFQSKMRTIKYQWAR